MKQIFWVVLLASLTGSATAQDKKVFVTVDKNNNLVFSDNPSPGATQVNVKDTATTMAPTTVVNNKPVVEASTKFEVAISKPEQQGTVRETSGTVYVSGQIKPMFAQGLRVKLYLDGQQVAGPTGNANFILHNVARGEHQLVLELLDQSGKIIATSPATTFYLHRASVNSPN